MRVLADQPPPLKIYPNAATGKNIFIYEDGKKVKEEIQCVSGDKEKEGQNEEEKKGMDWEPPPLFGDEVIDGKEGFGVQKSTNLSQTPHVPPLASSLQPSSSSNFRHGPSTSDGLNKMEEERKRMDMMEKEMMDSKK